MNRSAMIKPFFVACIILAYSIMFAHYDNLKSENPPQLTPALPETIYKGSLGFLQQLGAEVLYIKTKVFLGGSDPVVSLEKTMTLSNYFEIVNSLHPDFIDTYHFTESTLPWISPEQTRIANRILINGTQTHPDNYMLPFYLGFNHFYFLKEHKAASTYFWQSSKLEGAPSWFGHLAATLSSKSGDIIGGLILLRAMERNESSEVTKARYQHDIVEHEKAVAVFKAVQLFQSKHGRYPNNLMELTPETLPALPIFSNEYKLIYAPPELRLVKHDEEQ